jgi:hypothetical protein
MLSTSALFCLRLGALLAFVAVICRLPTRLIELAMAADFYFLLLPPATLLLFVASSWSRPPPGITHFMLTVIGPFLSWMAKGFVAAAVSGLCAVQSFPDFVDELLRQEELRSLVEDQLSTLRPKYKRQREILATLSRRIAEVCTEHNTRGRELPAALFMPRLRHGMTAAEIQDTEWSEPQLWVKMCKSCLSFLLSLLGHCPSSSVTFASPVSTEGKSPSSPRSFLWSHGSREFAAV